MKIRQRRLLAGLVLILGVLAMFPLPGIAAEGRPVLILADVSGSMQEIADISLNEEKESTKAEVLKELLLRLGKELPGCDTGIWRVRHIAGDESEYEPFLEIAKHEQKDMTDRIVNDFLTDYAVFNRRTPLGDVLRQLDERKLEETKGNLTLLLISDGRDSFYETDEEASSLHQTKVLKEKYGRNLVLHTVFMAQKEKCEEDDKGEALLREMAEIAGGKHFFGKALMDDGTQLSALANLLCEKPLVAEVREEPVPVPVVVPAPEPEPTVTAEGPKDTDRDGVYDPDDECPGTPLGATVNIKGCWILEGVRFETNKWNIRPQFYPILDEAAKVLEKNPDLSIEIQGHTDSRGSAAYNQRLSERRAESVRSYFVRKGISPERLSAAGYGLTKPVAPNTTSEGRAMNRRVELEVSEK